MIHISLHTTRDAGSCNGCTAERNLVAQITVGLTEKSGMAIRLCHACLTELKTKLNQGESRTLTQLKI